MRKDRNLTQQNVADVLGIDRTTYTVYELGSSTPSPATLVKLSMIYNVTVGYLLGVEENNPELCLEAGSAPAPILGDDPLARLKKDEKELLLYYRVIPMADKRAIIEELKKCAQQLGDKI